jgi:RHS repeat-associated protein
VNPDHTYQKTMFDPWRQESWDANDTVLQADPSADPDVGGFFQRLPAAAYSPTWYAQRSAGGLGPREQDAAAKSAAHANTPGVAYLDSQGRTFLKVADDAGAGKFETRMELDIQGNTRSITDPLGRIAAVYDYNVTRNRIRESSMEAGSRWLLDDAAQKSIRAWDDRGHNMRSTYDALRRPVGMFVLGTDAVLSDPRTRAAEMLYEMTVYGEGLPSDQALNLRARVYQRFDCVGVVTNKGHNAAAGRDEAYDFKGNLLRTSRQYLADAQALPNWSGAPPALTADLFESNTTFDALNRPVASTTPDSSVTRFGYDVAGNLKTVDANLLGAGASTPFVSNVDYDARGRRALLALGNSASTAYSYDPLTLRLSRLITTRQGVPANQSVLQDLTYTYDPSANVTHLQDDADIQNTVFFRNRRVDPSYDFTYDAIYRLIAASGREYLGLAAGVPSAPSATSYNDLPRIGLAHPEDGNAVGTYAEQYQYDAGGNLQQLTHHGADPANPGWSRTYAYNETSLIEPARKSNRLSQTTINAGAALPLNENYAHDVHGNMTAMPQLQAMAWDFKNTLIQTSRQAVNGSDADGIQRQGERTFYAYDATGIRARKTTLRQNGTLKNQRFYLGDLEVYREYDAAGATVTLERQTLHIMDDKHRLAMIESKTVDVAAAPGTLPSSAIRYQFGNHLDSASLELDDTGAVISYEEYYPFGSTSYQAGRSIAEVSLKRYRYTGKERDEETGLQYNRARYYACWLGRWTSADPIGVGDGTNLYSYVNNSPVVMHDPNGTDGDAPLHANDPAQTGDHPPDTTTVTVTDPSGHETTTTTPDPNAAPPPDKDHPPPILLTTTFGQPWRGVPKYNSLLEFTLSINGVAGLGASPLAGSGSLGGTWLGSVRYGFGPLDLGPVVGITATPLSSSRATAGGFLGATAHVPIALSNDNGLGIYLSPLVTFGGPLSGGGSVTSFGGSAALAYGHEPLPGTPGAGWDFNLSASLFNDGSLNFPAGPSFRNFLTVGPLFSYSPESSDDHVGSAWEFYANYVHGDPLSSETPPSSTNGVRAGFGFSRQYSERVLGLRDGSERTNAYAWYLGLMTEYANIQPVTPAGSSMTPPAVNAFTIMAIVNITLGGNVRDH